MPSPVPLVTRPRIALGTAQFGLHYGIANRHGRIGRAEVAAILDCAAAAGIDTLDTAMAYGESEQRLGDVGVGGWRVISKLPALPSSCADAAEWARQRVRESLERLGITRLHALLLHRPLDLLRAEGPALWSALIALRDEHRVERVGLSIYDPTELDVVWPRYRPQVVQAPLNVLDRRLIASGWLTRMCDEGTEVHARSVFLQGLLLMDSASRPRVFSQWQPLWERWDRWLRAQSLSPLKACLSWALSRTEVSRVVVGVDTLHQFEEILAAMAEGSPEPPADLSCADRDLVDPSRWVLQ